MTDTPQGTSEQTSPRTPVDALVSTYDRTLDIPDLDAGFGLKISTMVAASIPVMYQDFADNVDVAAIRERGLASVITFAEFERQGGPLAVAGPLRIGVTTRHCELSGAGPGAPAARVGFDCDYRFTSPPGAGDPRRYREIVDPRPAACGRGRIILTMIRPFAPAARRLVAESPAELAHLRLIVLDQPHPTASSLGTVDPGFTEVDCSAPDLTGVFGNHHTDTNQNVFTAHFFALCEDYLTTLVAAAGLDAAAHRIDRVAALFKVGFTAGARYAVRGTLHRDGDRTLALLGVHHVLPDGQPHLKPAVSARLVGRLA